MFRNSIGDILNWRYILEMYHNSSQLANYQKKSDCGEMILSVIYIHYHYLHHHYYHCCHYHNTSLHICWSMFYFHVQIFRLNKLLKLLFLDIYFLFAFNSLLLMTSKFNSTKYMIYLITLHDLRICFTLFPLIYRWYNFNNFSYLYTSVTIVPLFYFYPVCKLGRLKQSCTRI